MGHPLEAAGTPILARSDLDESLYLPLGHFLHQETPGPINTLIEDWTTRLAGAAAVRIPNADATAHAGA
jgi:hypothetical protein